MEQTVSKERSIGSRALYGLVWALAILFALMGLFFAANVVGASESGALEISWYSAIGCVLTLASAFALWRFKDRLNLEYDYAIRDGCLFVTAVLNNRRRIPKLRLELGRIAACGRGSAPGKGEALCLHTGTELTYIQYEEKGERRMALLELNDDMIAALRRGLRPGAWRNSEGMTSNHAGLS